MTVGPTTSFNAVGEPKAAGAPENQRKSKSLVRAALYVNVPWPVTVRSILISVTVIVPSGLHISLSRVIKLVMANENLVGWTVILLATLHPLTLFNAVNIYATPPLSVKLKKVYGTVPFLITETGLTTFGSGAME